MGTAGTWYGELLDDAEVVLRLVDQIGAHDDRSRPYARVEDELRADGFVPVQKATADLANRIFGARQAGEVDEGIVYEAMGLLVDLMPYMRSVSIAGVECDGGFAFLVSRIEKLLGSMLMTVRSRMGIADETPEIPW